MRTADRRLTVVRLPQPAAAALPVIFDRAGPVTQRRLLSELLVRVFSAASPPDRARLLEVLMRPLGLLSLAAVANGLFATWRLRSGWGDLRVPAEETQGVSPRNLMALAEHAQQVSAETLDGLVQVLASSPVITTSASAVVLLVLLVRRAASRRPSTGDEEP